MEGPLINISGGGPSVETAAAVAGAVGEILTIAGRERTPEAVTLAALEVVRVAFQSCSPVGTTISGCHLTGEDKSVRQPE